MLRPIERIGKGNYGLWTKEEMSGVDEGFVRRVFEQLKWGSEDIEWDCYALAFEAALNVKRYEPEFCSNCDFSSVPSVP